MFFVFRSCGLGVCIRFMHRLFVLRLVVLGVKLIITNEAKKQTSEKQSVYWKVARPEWKIDRIHPAIDHR